MDTETQTIDSTPDEGEALLQAAQEHDLKHGDFDQPTDDVTPQPEPQPQPEPEPKEPEPPAEPARDPITGQFLKKETPPAEPKGDEPPGKPETDYAKAKKEQERRERSWQKVEAEKAAVRAEAQRLEQERQRMEYERQELIAKTRPRAQKDGYTADDYRKASDGFAREGDWENAFKAAKEAQQLYAYEQQWYAQQEQQYERTAIQHAFQENLNETIKKYPAADPATGSELSKRMAAIFESRPHLLYSPNGAMDVAEVAILQLVAEENQVLKEKLAQYEQKEQQRQQRSQPLRGGPTAPSESRKFDDMSLEEQGKYLEQAAEEADMSYGIR